jgi:hypothetical protein
MIRSLNLVGGLALVVSAAFATATASADPLAVTLTAGYPVPSGLNYQYDYTLEVDGFETFVAPSNYFTIVDFVGYQTASITAPAGWVVSAPLFDAVANANLLLLGAFDNPAIPNLTFTRSGAAFGPATSSPGFAAISSNGTIGSLYYFAFHRRNNLPATSTGQITASAVPEPWNIATFAVTLIPVGLFYLSRKHRS